MVECGRGCQLPLHSTVGRMHGEPHDTECNAMHASLCHMTSVGGSWGTGEGTGEGTDVGQVEDRWRTGGGQVGDRWRTGGGQVGDSWGAVGGKVGQGD